MTIAATFLPHYRRRALAGLDGLIVQAEAARARWQAGAPREGMARHADERLALLRASRRALLAEDGRAP